MSSSVEETLSDVRDMIELVVEGIGSDAIGTSVEQIESQSRDGFIAFTDGGWDGVVTFDLHSEASRATALIEPHLIADHKEMVAAFRQEHDIDDDIEDCSDHPAFEDWEMAWEHGGDGTCWFVKARAILYLANGTHSRRNETGKDEILFCLGINTDFNYGRDSISWMRGVGTEWIWERTVAVEDITEELLGELHDQFMHAWMTDGVEPEETSNDVVVQDADV